jgi:hypothetical protein
MMHGQAPAIGRALFFSLIWGIVCTADFAAGMVAVIVAPGG